MLSSWRLQKACRRYKGDYRRDEPSGYPYCRVLRRASRPESECSEQQSSLALPTTQNVDGRPVWEPPVLDYSELIDEAYEKKREAMVKFTNNDVARATEIMDVDTEVELLQEYSDWVAANANNAEFEDDSERAAFFDRLRSEVMFDLREVRTEWQDLKTDIYDMGKREDGKWEVKGYEYITAERGNTSDVDPVSTEDDVSTVYEYEPSERSIYVIEQRFNKRETDDSESTPGDVRRTEYEHETSNEGSVENTHPFVKRKRRDTESRTSSMEHESSVEIDNYETCNDPTEGGRLSRMAEGKVVYFGEAVFTTYENIPEGVTWETPLLKLEQTLTEPQGLVLCLRFRHFSNWEKHNRRFRIGLRRFEHV